MRTCSYDLVWLAAERTPDHLALVDDRTERKFTYRELLHEVDVVAAGLAERGIGRGSRVATALPNVIEHCILLLALQRLQAVPAMLNFRLQAAELAKLVKQGTMAGAVLRDEAAVQAVRPTAGPAGHAPGRCRSVELPRRPEEAARAALAGAG